MLKRLILMQLCGGATTHFPWRMKGCSCSAHLSAVLNSWTRSWGKWHPNSKYFWIGFPSSQTCRALGYCSCSAHLLGPITSCGSCTLVLLESSQFSTITGAKRCFQQLLHTTVSGDSWDIASMALVMGGLGLTSVHGGRQVSWSSWADVLHMVPSRHPEMAATMLRRWASDNPEHHLGGALAARDRLQDMGFHLLEWSALPNEGFPDFQDVGPRHHAQRETTKEVHFFMNTAVWPLLSLDAPLIRSQGFPLAGLPLSCCSALLLTRLDPQVFRVLLLRRLSLPLPPTQRTCRCGRFLDSLGHHRAACATVAVLGRRGFALESAAARVCREAGARVTVNALLRDLENSGSRRCRQRPTRSGRRLSPLVARTTTGHWHDDGVSSRAGWGAPPPVRRLCPSWQVSMVGHVLSFWLVK